MGYESEAMIGAYEDLADVAHAYGYESYIYQREKEELDKRYGRRVLVDTREPYWPQGRQEVLFHE